jgi:hypothetical protein
VTRSHDEHQRLVDAQFDRHGYRKRDPHDVQGNPYARRTCLLCGADIAAPLSRIRWVLRMHVDRCERATAEERLAFRRTRRWARRSTP